MVMIPLKPLKKGSEKEFQDQPQQSHHKKSNHFSAVEKAKDLEPANSNCVIAGQKLSSQRLQGELISSQASQNIYPCETQIPKHMWKFSSVK